MMYPVNPLVCTPDIDSLTQASERAPLSLLAAAALCARNALVVEHRGEFEAHLADAVAEDPTPAISLVAMQAIDHIDDLLESLRLYEATLRDHLRARLYQDMPF